VEKTAMGGDFGSWRVKPSARQKYEADQKSRTQSPEGILTREQRAWAWEESAIKNKKRGVKCI